MNGNRRGRMAGRASIAWGVALVITSLVLPRGAAGNWELKVRPTISRVAAAQLRDEQERLADEVGLMLHRLHSQEVDLRAEARAADLGAAADPLSEEARARVAELERGREALLQRLRELNQERLRGLATGEARGFWTFYRDHARFFAWATTLGLTALGAFLGTHLGWDLLAWHGGGQVFTGIVGGAVGLAGGGTAMNYLHDPYVFTKPGYVAHGQAIDFWSEIPTGNSNSRADEALSQARWEELFFNQLAANKSGRLFTDAFWERLSGHWKLPIPRKRRDRERWLDQLVRSSGEELVLRSFLAEAARETRRLASEIQVLASSFRPGTEQNLYLLSQAGRLASLVNAGKDYAQVSAQLDELFRVKAEIASLGAQPSYRKVLEEAQVDLEALLAFAPDASCIEHPQATLCTVEAEKSRFTEFFLRSAGNTIAFEAPARLDIDVFAGSGERIRVLLEPLSPERARPDQRWMEVAAAVVRPPSGPGEEATRLAFHFGYERKSATSLDPLRPDSATEAFLEALETAWREHRLGEAALRQAESGSAACLDAMASRAPGAPEAAPAEVIVLGGRGEPR